MKGLIALDIDGTITADPYSIPKRVVSFFQELYLEGWTFLFVTGRPYTFAAKTLEVIPFPYFFAVQNGSDLFSMPEKELIAREYLTADLIPVLDNLYKGKDEDFLIYSGPLLGDFCYYRPARFSPWMLEHLAVVRSISSEPWQEETVFDFPKEQKFPLIKCLGTQEEMQSLHGKLRTIPNISVTCIKDPLGEGVYLNLITAPKATKGEVLKRFRLRFPNALFIAAGDDNNDLSMLEEADVSIAMETAPKELFACADILAASAKQEGIIEALKQATQKGRG